MTRDRTGDLVDEEDGTHLSSTHHCDHGWHGEDSEGRRIPCLVCKPHLRGRTADVHDCAVR